MNRRLSILLVDDDEDARFLLGAMLRRRGFDVEVVGSAAECLQRLEAEPSRIVVTDVQMPEMSGVELCRQIRARFPDVVAVVVSGAATPHVRAEVAEAGAFTFLPKPVTITALEAAVLEASGTSSALRGSALPTPTT